ncbi:hypothetical protein T492DRAFT_947672 [Pavlovales sp. CCMP2436]|nr:hypothetical protein T492DRAFT_947672 [Pavlovales sp. CCMP2436]
MLAQPSQPGARDPLLAHCAVPEAAEELLPLGRREGAVLPLADRVCATTSRPGSPSPQISRAAVVEAVSVLRGAEVGVPAVEVTPGRRPAAGVPVRHLRRRRGPGISPPGAGPCPAIARGAACAPRGSARRAPLVCALQPPEGTALSPLSSSRAGG